MVCWSQRQLQYLSFTLILGLRNVFSQEQQFVNVTKFDETVNFKTDVCDRQHMFFTDQIELEDALRGLNLSIVTTNYPSPNENALFTLVDGKIPEDRSLLYVRILDELAKRAGFEWRNSFVAVDPLNPVMDGDRTWGDLLLWEVGTFDISMDYWAKSVGRMADGVAFPESWYDASIILVADVQPVKRVLNFWAFLTPFEYLVWVAIVVAVLFSGLTYYLLERLNSDSDERDMENKPLGTVFLSAMVFTGHFDFQPASNAARIHSFSWSFWALIVVSAYTANLASFLVSRQDDGLGINSIQEAVELNVPICIQAGSIQDETLSSQYQSINLIRKNKEEEVFTSVISGECVLAATQKSSFDIYERTKSINPDCTLQWVGRVVHIIPSGMATSIDTGTRCSSLISYVLDLHLVKMKSDGFLEREWERHLKRLSDLSCAEKAERRKKRAGVTVALSLHDMGGIFILHAALSTFAILVALFQFFYIRKQTTQEMVQRLKNTPRPRRRSMKEMFKAASLQNMFPPWARSNSSSDYNDSVQKLSTEVDDRKGSMMDVTQTSGLSSPATSVVFPEDEQGSASPLSSRNYLSPQPPHVDPSLQRKAFRTSSTGSLCKGLRR